MRLTPLPAGQAAARGIALRGLIGFLLLTPVLASCAAKQEPLSQPAPPPAEQVRQLAAPSVVSLIGFGLDRGTDELHPVGQGSAIAVTAHTFLTDCRNLVGADAVVLSSGRQQGLAYLDPEYYGEDVCVLRSQEIVGKPVHAVRDAGDIRPGEQVYAVADPEGLGPVLQAAALTGKRRDSGIAWLQTTAAVTTGWPGAAVFDTDGNLLGVAIRSRGIAGQQVMAFTQDSPLIPTTLVLADTGGAQRLLAVALPEPAAGPADEPAGTLTSLPPTQRASLDRYFQQRARANGNPGAGGSRP